MAAAKIYDWQISFNLVIFMHHIVILLMSYGQLHVPACIYTFSGMRTPQIQDGRRLIVKIWLFT